MKNLEEISKKARILSLKISAEGKAAHIGSCLSVTDILVSVYFDVFNEQISPKNFKKDDCVRVILSKGHAVAALYSILHLKGFISEKELFSYDKNGGLPGHADTSVYGIDFSTGSLGHGLAVGAGMALARKINNNLSPVVVVMGDGECEEGAVWEAVNFAVVRKLNNLIAIVDSNNLQAYDRTSDLSTAINKKFKGFGMNVIEADGHSFESLRKAFKIALSSQIPSVIIADTIKGKGVQGMEDKLEWHYKTPKGDELGDINA